MSSITTTGSTRPPPSASSPRCGIATTNGVVLGVVDFGEIVKIGDADNEFWQSLGMSVAKSRNLFGLVYPMSVVGGAVERTGGRSTGMVRPGFAGTQRLGWATTGDSYP